MIDTIKCFASIKKTYIHGGTVNSIISNTFFQSKYTHISGVAFLVSKFIFCCHFIFLCVINKNYLKNFGCYCGQSDWPKISFASNVTVLFLQDGNKHSCHKLLRKKPMFDHNPYDNCHPDTQTIWSKLKMLWHQAIIWRWFIIWELFNGTNHIIQSNHGINGIMILSNIRQNIRLVICVIHWIE